MRGVCFGPLGNGNGSVGGRKNVKTSFVPHFLGRSRIPMLLERTKVRKFGVKGEEGREKCSKKITSIMMSLTRSFFRFPWIERKSEFRGENRAMIKVTFGFCVRMGNLPLVLLLMSCVPEMGK